MPTKTIIPKITKKSNLPVDTKNQLSMAAAHPPLEAWASGTTNSVTGISAGTGSAIYGKGGTKGKAGLFDGQVQVNGNIQVDGNLTATGDIYLSGADCAEQFDLAEAAGKVEPGTLVILDEMGGVRASSGAYDRKVVGVVAGAGHYRPGMVMDKVETGAERTVVSLMGKVFCKADASYGAIHVGDLLTSSETPGHAMRAGDAGKAFGTVVGKALGRLESGQGLIPMLIALQ